MTEQEHIKDVVLELKARLLQKCNWDLEDPCCSEPVENLVMLEKIERFLSRLPVILDSDSK